MKDSLISKDTLILDFCKVEIYNHYVIVEINEGVNVTPKYNRALIKINEKYFSNQPFVYITNRVNSYSVDPKIYHDTAQIETLKGITVVSKKYHAKINAQIEKIFFNKPFEIFTELEDAVKWADELIKIK
ncbi:hypothetical protein [Winogradskyella vidalii]|uniref:hypothetical protein n=1 Tax=Winogradskyella vidalii TaxID=2615024 RepID=UPI0015CA1723|nr:hypothetical protein [Winogradskyella vidalii]